MGNFSTNRCYFLCQMEKYILGIMFIHALFQLFIRYVDLMALKVVSGNLHCHCLHRPLKLPVHRIFLRIHTGLPALQGYSYHMKRQHIARTCQHLKISAGLTYSGHPGVQKNAAMNGAVLHTVPPQIGRPRRRCAGKDLKALSSLTKLMQCLVMVFSQQP